MAVLKPADLYGRVTQMLRNPDPKGTLATQAVEHAVFGFDGMAEDSHTSLTRPACVRTRRTYEEGTEIRNVRQLTIIGAGELNDIETAMELPGPLKAEWLGTNMVIDGIPSLTLLPPSSRIVFENGPSFVVDMENEPCKGPADIIDEHFPGFGKRFVKAAMHKRGITAWVERTGELSLDAPCRLHCPPLRRYPYLAFED